MLLSRETTTTSLKCMAGGVRLHISTYNFEKIDLGSSLVALASTSKILCLQLGNVMTEWVVEERQHFTNAPLWP